MADVQDTFTGTRPVDERHRFDEAALDAWMRANVEGYAGPLEVRQFKGGQSNPTYELRTPARSYVLRRKPPGKLLPSAHAVDREFRVISALHPTGFPVARPYGLCTDDAVIGTMFYVMERVEGRILWDPLMPGMSNADRSALYRAEIATLAKLHTTDYAVIGLGDFGKPGNYFSRQIDRWTRQYKASETEEIPEFDRLIDWLPKTTPADDRTSIVHGDYRLDNMVMKPGAPDVAAVLDWELCTLGNPLADFSYFLSSWVMEGEGARSLGGADLPSLGIPTIPEVVDLYCELTGRDGLPELDWYFSYNLFRLAGICQGIAGRMRDGTAASPQAAASAARVRPLSEAAWTFAQRAGA